MTRNPATCCPTRPDQTSGHNFLVYVADSPIHGRGLFAAGDLARGTLIGRYEGREVSDDGTYVLWIENDEGNGWTGIEGDNVMRFMNHSSEPNAEMDGRSCYAINDISHHSEINIDYGWESEGD